MSYGTNSGFVEYHEARGRTVPAAWQLNDGAIITSARLVASEWLDAKYRSIWIGQPTDGYEQVRQWPRVNATTATNPPYTYPDDVVPDPVIYAVYELAYYQASNPGVLQPIATPKKYKRVRVEGAIEVEYNLDLSGTADIQPQLSTVDSLMYPLLDPNASGTLSALTSPSVRV